MFLPGVSLKDESLWLAFKEGEASEFFNYWGEAPSLKLFYFS